MVRIMKIPPDMQLKDKRPCCGLRADLKMCVLETSCVKEEKRLPKDCLASRHVPAECTSIAYELFECKRQLLDMRRRFRGRRGY